MCGGRSKLRAACVLVRELMPMSAVGLASVDRVVPIAPEAVHPTGNDVEVVRVDAPSVPAQVIHCHVFGNRAPRNVEG